MITEDYVSFEVAKLLKEKGFDGECMSMYITPKPHAGMGNPNEAKIAPHGRDSHYYDGYLYQCEAPTLQMAMKWLREKHRLHIDIDPSESDWNPTVITLEDWTCIVKYGDKIPIQDTYEQACEAAIKYCLQNLI